MVASPRRIRSLTSALVAVRRLNSTSGCSAAKRFKIADSRPPASVPTTASAIGPKFGRASALGIRHHHPPNLAQHRAAGDPLEQWHAELLLQQRYAPRDRGLRAVQRLRRARNAAAAVNGQEGEKRIAVHVSSMQKADDT